MNGMGMDMEGKFGFGAACTILFMILAAFCTILGMGWGIDNKIEELAAIVSAEQETAIIEEPEQPPKVIIYYVYIYDGEKNDLEPEEPENDKNIVKPQAITEDFDVFIPCGYSQEQIEYAVSDHRRDALKPYVDTLLEAEERYGVNALYLLCKFGYESGWGRYMAADNNIGGWRKDDGSFKDFDSVEECILYIAEKISTEYREKAGHKLEDICGRYNNHDGYMETLLEIMDGINTKIIEMRVS